MNGSLLDMQLLIREFIAHIVLEMHYDRMRIAHVCVCVFVSCIRCNHYRLFLYYFNFIFSDHEQLHTNLM